MQGSSDEEDSLSFNNFNNSLNETANSIHMEPGELDRDMQDCDECLIDFIENELVVKIRLDGLQGERMFKEIDFKVLSPKTGVFFLPHLFLIMDRRVKMPEVRDGLCNLKRQDYNIQLNQDEILLEVHNEAQFTSYRIRTLTCDANLHSQPELLDPKCLVDKLFDYYCAMYSSIYFKETAILILYWAHQKDMLSREISEHCLKMLIIVIFVNFGYGVRNIVHDMVNDRAVIEQNRKMNSHMRINKKGETEIDPQLTKYYKRYTVQEKKGFYMPRIKRYMRIKDILPIHFPLMGVDVESERQMKAEVEEQLRKVLDNQREKMSICKNLSKVFKFLHNKFDKQMRVVVDFEVKLAYRQDYGENFELEFMHPVLGQSMGAVRGHQVGRMRQNIKVVHEMFARDPLEALKLMMVKMR